MQVCENIYLQMKQVFSYEPPSARRGLIHNSDDKEEEDPDLEEIEERVLFFLKQLIHECLRSRL